MKYSKEKHFRNYTVGFLMVLSPSIQVSFLTFLYSSECVYSSGKRVLFFFVFLVGDRGEYSICTEPWRFKAVFIVAIFFYFLFRV